MAEASVRSAITAMPTDDYDAGEDDDMLRINSYCANLPLAQPNSCCTLDSTKLQTARADPEC